MDIETTRAPTQEPGLQSLLARGARQRRSVAFLRCFADRFATVRLALRVVVGRGLAPAAPPPNFAPPLRSTRRRTILGVYFIVAVSLCSGAVTRYQVSYSSFAPPQEPGLQPYFARGAYQRRNSTSGCLPRAFGGVSTVISRARRFPMPVHSLLRPPTQYSPT